MSRPDIEAFDLAGPLPDGRIALEASAGTGKTYSLTGLIVRHIVEAAVPADQFLVVTFTRAAANELRERTRATLEIAAQTFSNGAPPASHPWMSAFLDTSAVPAGRDPQLELADRHRRVTDAISRFDELTITTIHGFCQLSLGQLGVRSGSNPDAVLVDSVNDIVAEVCRDLIVTALADQPDLLNSSSGTPRVSNPTQAERELIASVGALMNNPGAELVPIDPVEPLAARWVELVRRARDAVVHRQNARGEIGYDTLISGLHGALTDPVHGAAVATQLGQRYAVVLVDEFQDTDRMQWDVFERSFSKRTLITVGDPKQAIYRFRGADVHAYLDAVESPVDAHGATLRRLGLATNHRSDRAVLDGVATIFDGATLGDPRISFAAVRARDDAPLSAVSRVGDSGPSPAVHLRVVPLDDDLRTKVTREISMPAVRSLVLNDLVARVIDLLDHARLEAEVHPEAARAVEPGDIAVLVPSHAEANNVAEALRRARVPAVRTRTGSVLRTQAATQWRLVLAALAQPHQVAVVRAASLGWFMAADTARLSADDTVLAELQMHAADLGDRLRAVGVSAFYDEQKGRSSGGTPTVTNLLTTVLGRPGGERHLTDLDHISELLAEATQRRASDPAQVLRVLDDLIAHADDRDEGAMRRIDSDAHAVQITTIHAAKGLEYPIVLVPFGFKPSPNLSTPYSYTAPEGRRTIDVASRVPWDGGLTDEGDETTRNTQELRRHLARVDIEGDELRLLYVALTRAKHRVEIWWASISRANTSALGRVLVDRYGAGPVQNSLRTLVPKKRGTGFREKEGFPEYQLRDEAKTVAQLEMLASFSEGSVGLTMIDAQVQGGAWAGRRPSTSVRLALAADHGRAPIADRRWQRWSFSRLGSVFEADGLAGAGTTSTPAANTDAVDHHDAFDDRGGYDEPLDAFDETDPGGEEAAGSGQLRLGVGPVAHLADVVGGTRFGTFVHAVLEHVAFDAADLTGDVRALVLEHAATEGLEIGADLPLDTITAGLVAAVRTPLGPLFGGRRLADIAAKDRLTELAFDLPIAGGTGSMTAGTIGEILLAHLGRNDPVRPFARRLAGEFAHFDIAGWMNGSIDGVFRVPADCDGDGDGDGDHRYLIVDYKTNRLHQPGSDDPVAAYAPRLLIPAMEHSRYPLQAVLYTVALHRYLRWRLGAAYDPARHLGGTAYLFVRGMVGPGTPTVGGVAHGVFSWRPPVAAVLAIDTLFARGASAPGRSRNRNAS